MCNYNVSIKRCLYWLKLSVSASTVAYVIVILPFVLNERVSYISRIAHDFNSRIATYSCVCDVHGKPRLSAPNVGLGIRVYAVTETRARNGEFSRFYEYVVFFIFRSVPSSRSPLVDGDAPFVVIRFRTGCFTFCFSPTHWTVAKIVGPLCVPLERSEQKKHRIKRR